MKSFLLVSVVVALLSFSACGGGGTIGTPPPPADVTISIVVSGLTASNPGLVIENNGVNPLTISSNGTYPLTVATGSAYAITIPTQPTGTTCSIPSGASGTANSNVTVNVTCGGALTLSAAVTGLVGTLELQDDKGDTLTFTADDTQTFATPYASGAQYSVSGLSQPAGQSCTLGNNATGTITANTTVAVSCSTSGGNTGTISATVTGLTGTLVLQDDKGDTLTFTTNTTLTFASSYASGATYTVSVKTQPAGQNCTLSSNATGTIAASSTTVTATCTTTTVNYTLSATASGLTGTLVLQDDKSETLTFTGNTSQSFPTQYASGSTYAVTVKTQPTGQTCTLSSNFTGTITANTTVTATCVTNTPNDTISVAASGLTGTLVVKDDKNDTLTFTSNNTQQFATSYTSGSTYAVTITTQPTGQTCTLGANASGTITADTTVTATCVSNFTISVAVTGLTGTLVMQDDKSDNLTFTSNITQTFATTYASGSTYTVSVKTPPSGQTCALSSNASGTLTGNITVTATCTTTVQNFTLSVTTTGLSGGTLVVQDDQSDTLSFTSNNKQTFTASYASGSTYTVTVQSQPTGQTCTLGSNASGTITANTTVTATCAPSGGSLTVSVKVSGLSGTVILENDEVRRTS